LPQVIAIGNQKGGVGKTSTLLGLASAASHAGIRTLVVDMDPQGNATTVLGGPGDVTMGGVLEQKRKGHLAEAVVASNWDHVDVAGADLTLAYRESEQDQTFIFRLREAMEGVVSNYDLVLIDLQPSVGTLVLTGLVAADGVLAVTEPTMEASQGVSEFMRTITDVTTYFNQSLDFRGVIMNKVPARGREAEYRVQEVREALGDQIWEPVVPYRSLMAESRGSGLPVHSYGKRAADLTTAFDAHLARIQKEN